MADEWSWWWGVGAEPECYHPADSRDDAIELATDDAKDNSYDRMTICEGKPWDLIDDIFDADRVLEDWHERNEDAQDEDGELRMDPTSAQKRELENTLNAAFADWRARHKLGRAWALDTRNVEVLEIEFPADAP